MEYYEIGEMFEYDRVVLEVVEGTGRWAIDCVDCAVIKSENCHIFHHCSRKYRADKKMFITNSLNNVKQKK